MAPQIGDGEVAELALITTEELRGLMMHRKFELNCNMIWPAFLIRHGHLTAGNWPDFLMICATVHCEHDLFIP